MFAWVMLVCITPSVFAQTANEAQPQFEFFEQNGSVVAQEKFVQTDYRLVTEAIKKVNNQWRTQEQWESGGLVRTTYLLDRKVSYQHALTALNKALKEFKGYTLAFSCQGLDCGSSNGWANHYFKIKQLYGLDQTQFYSVIRSADKANEQINVVYLVRRGNRRVYLQVDHLVVNSPLVVAVNPNVQSEVTQHGAAHVLTIPSASLDEDEKALEAALKPVVAQLQQNPKWFVRVVGHDQTSATYPLRKQQSLHLANRVRQLLVNLGMASQRLSVHGTADLLPGQLPASVSLVVTDIQVK